MQNQFEFSIVYKIKHRKFARFYFRFKKSFAHSGISFISKVDENICLKRVEKSLNEIN